MPSPPIDSIRAVMRVWRLRGKIIRIAPCLLCCVRQLGSMMSTQMNSSYSSLDWVLSHCVPSMTYNVFGGTLNLAQPTMVFPFTACLHLCRGTASQCVHCVVSICTVDHRASEAHTFWCENMARFLTTQCSCPSFIGCTCDQHTK